jgi:septal ring factor EnvC (AmiA/AmiB activator)
VVEELQSVIKLLREDLSRARKHLTKTELKIHDSKNQLEDMERQLTLSKKQEDNQKQRIQELNFEVEKLRENDVNASFFSTNSNSYNNGLI